mgnify:CR=1 FL=1
MPVRIGNSYVSDAAAAFAKSAATKDTEEKGAKGTVADLSAKFSSLKFGIGTSPFQGSGMGNVSISPNILREMENDPAKREEYEALLYDIEQGTPEIFGSRPGIKSQGWVIDKDGGLRCWSIGASESGDRKPEASGTKRIEKKAWWQALLDEMKEKKKSLAAKAKKDIPQVEKPVNLMEELKAQQKEAEPILLANANKTMQLHHSGKTALAEAYLKGKQTAQGDAVFSNTDELGKFLQNNFSVVKGGMANISGKYLRDCLTDEDKRQKLFDNLAAADDTLAEMQGKVGFKSMKVTIDENGEMTTETSGGKVGVNEEKSRRQIAAAATRGDMRKVLALLEQDLQEVEEGLKQNMCDEAEVEKVKKLIEEAKEQMAKLPDRKPTPEEQTVMTVNMLI